MTDPSLVSNNCSIKKKQKYTDGSTAKNMDGPLIKPIYIRCGRVVTDFDWEAINRFNF